MKGWLALVVAALILAAGVYLSPAKPGPFNAQGISEEYSQATPPVVELFLYAMEKKNLACLSHPNGGCFLPEIRIAELPDGVLGQFKIQDPTYITVTPRLTPGSPAWNSVVVHEFSHWLDWYFDIVIRSKMQCRDYMVAEERSYIIQYAYLKDQGEEEMARQVWDTMKAVLAEKEVMCTMQELFPQ